MLTHKRVFSSLANENVEHSAMPYFPIIEDISLPLCDFFCIAHAQCDNLGLAFVIDDCVDSSVRLKLHNLEVTGHWVSLLSSEVSEGNGHIAQVLLLVIMHHCC